MNNIILCVCITSSYQYVFFIKLSVHETLSYFHILAILNNAVVVQLLNCFQFFATPWAAACQASLPFTVSHSLLKLMSIELVLPSNHLIFCHPPFLLPSIFPMSQPFPSDGQSIGASASVLTMNTQGLFPLEWTGLISLQSKRFSRVFFNTTVQKHQFFGTQLSLWSYSHICTWLLEKLWLDRPSLANWWLCFLICCQGLP